MEKLRNDIELQNKKRVALDAQAGETEKKVGELNLKLENVSLNLCLDMFDVNICLLQVFTYNVGFLQCPSTCILSSFKHK